MVFLLKLRVDNDLVKWRGPAILLSCPYSSKGWHCRHALYVFKVKSDYNYVLCCRVRVINNLTSNIMLRVRGASYGIYGHIGNLYHFGLA